MNQLTFDFGPPPPPDLDNFAGGRNGECLAALHALLVKLAAGEPPDPRIIYIWGPPGSGKTHLATALAARGAPGLTVVDDCDRLEPEAQEQLFHAFNRLIQSPGDAMVVFGAAPPGRLTLLPDLVSRLGWGIVFGLEPLDDEALEHAIRQAAQARGLVMEPEVSGYLLRHTRRDMATLKAILDRLDRLSLQQKRPLSLAMLRSLLDERTMDGRAPGTTAPPSDRMR